MFVCFVKVCRSRVCESAPAFGAQSKMCFSAPTLDPIQFDQAARRILERCERLAGCSDKPGKITRLFCSPAMQAAHEKLRDWIESAGLEVRIDSAANLIARLAGHRDGSSPESAPLSLIIGSHLDTVVDAGKYDGALGVLMGLAIAELITQTESALPFSLDIIAFSEEEGVRYQTPYIGSRALVADLPAELLRKTDADGIPMADALRSFGCDPGCLSEATYSGDQAIAYVEPHIEQGPVLELEGLPVGVVTGIAGQMRANFQFLGRAGHAGTVPMAARHDALAAAAQFICEIEEFALTRPGLTATVGQITVAPNVSNVIPGEVNLRLDLRHIDDESREAAFRQITHQAAVIAEDRELEFDLTSVEHHCAVRCDAGLTDLLEQAVEQCGIRPLRLPSGAGHDAVIMSRRFPVAMLFVRCTGGISHHPDESVTEPDVASALRVLWQFVMKLAGQRQSVTCP
jgi:allantoate deiminase